MNEKETDNEKQPTKQELAMLKLKQLVYRAREWKKMKDRLRNEVPKEENAKPVISEHESKITMSEKKAIPNMSKVKKFQYTLLILITILVLTNPSNESFKHFLYAKFGNSFSRNLNDGDATYGRQSNFFLFSIYTYNKDGDRGNKYIGIIGNFFSLGD